MGTKVIHEIRGPAAAKYQVKDVDGVAKIFLDDVALNLAPTERVETAIATNAITASETGKTFFLSAATEFASTLPAPAAGLEYTFIISAAPSGANYTVGTNGAADLFIGGVTCQTADDLGAYDANGDVITFVGAQSVVGDRVHVISDGTSWFVDGHSFVAEGVTITNT